MSEQWFQTETIGQWRERQPKWMKFLFAILCRILGDVRAIALIRKLGIYK